MVGWLTVLKLVPWQEVITNAPKVADAATRLWKATSRKAPMGDAPAAPDGTAVSTREPAGQAALQARLAAADSAIADLRQQMLDSSRLIHELAEQNAQLVQRVEAHRVRVLWLTVVTALLAVAAAAGVFWR